MPLKGKEGFIWDTSIKTVVSTNTIKNVVVVVIAAEILAVISLD